MFGNVVDRVLLQQANERTALGTDGTSRSFAGMDRFASRDGHSCQRDHSFRCDFRDMEARPADTQEHRRVSRSLCESIEYSGQGSLYSEY